MKQIIQSYKTGEIKLVDLPCPQVKRDYILVKTRASIVSVGTEKHMLGLAKKSLLGKAFARPDLVRRVIDKARSEGVMQAHKQAMSRLDTPVPLGYSASGVVVEVGEGVTEFQVGDRVAITGAGYAGHAEYNLTPILLAVKIPHRSNFGSSRLSHAHPSNEQYLPFEDAAFAALGGIALEAIRLSKAQLGARVGVIGLGLIGQIAIQLLASAGCHVIGMDISEAKVKMALEHGLDIGVTSKDELILAVREMTKNHGVDSVIILAASKSNEPLEVAAEIARERAIIVASGLVSLNIPRKVFYEKELELAVSRAWGPGLYDMNYAEKGIDYPLAYARWTAKRNVNEFLVQLAKNRVVVNHLISHRFSIEESLKAYELILKNKEPVLGITLNYPGAEESEESSKKVVIRPTEPTSSSRGTPVSIGLIGAGQFAQGTILPAIKDLIKKDFSGKIKLRGVATSTGLKARHVADKFGFSYITSDYKGLLDDQDINLIFILTRHGNHANLVCEALKTGKNVFVEKPLCINQEQLQEIIRIHNESRITNNPLLMVGYNRRFAPTIQWMKKRFESLKEPIAIHCTVNAGYVPSDSWVHDPAQGGGRIVGEICHFVDLAQYLTDSLPGEVFASSLSSNAYQTSDNVNINMKMENGSIVSITYVASGDKTFPRERIEVFGGGAVGVIDNFKQSTCVRMGKNEKFRTRGVDRGHRDELKSLFEGILSGRPVVCFNEYVQTALATFAMEESLRKKEVVQIPKQ